MMVRIWSELMVGKRLQVAQLESARRGIDVRGIRELLGREELALGVDDSSERGSPQTSD